MNILVIFIDKIASAPIQSLIEIYENKLKFYCRCNIKTIIVPKNVRYKSIGEQKKEEEKLVLTHLKDNDFVILLDEKGKEMSSLEFSKWIEQQSFKNKRLVFITGGPYGFSKELKNKYFNISLSKMTFSHELVRIIFLEQLYRAFSIIKGQKYHHD
ncbi:MAG: 23S rRNA (pseudouridine(1915)-N(3))-methyltransferase RlmH [Bacteroidia bacterium]|nr:23S rRNA (pseudouridine(1915)-N(3))-methyltransferase RlmH [Bacteroidia bacterium]